MDLAGRSSDRGRRSRCRCTASSDEVVSLLWNQMDQLPTTNKKMLVVKGPPDTGNLLRLFGEQYSPRQLTRQGTNVLLFFGSLLKEAGNHNVLFTFKGKNYCTDFDVEAKYLQAFMHDEEIPRDTIIVEKFGGEDGAIDPKGSVKMD